MKNNFYFKFLFCAVSMMLLGSWCQAGDLVSASIKIKQLSWQEYVFTAMFDQPAESTWQYYWTIDGTTYTGGAEWNYFFNSGDHTVQLKVVDSQKRASYDTVRLSVKFWTLQNNRLWWTLYFMAAAATISYWSVKVYYLLNRSKVSRRARMFLDILDEHGWTENLIKKLKSKKQNPANNQ